MSVQHIRLFKFRGIETLALSDLDRINVVCGKNNAGKSSILGAIENLKQRERGITTTDSMLDELAVALEPSHSVNPDNHEGRKELHTFLKVTLQSGEHWFQSDNEALLARWLKAKQTSPLRRYRSHDEDVKKRFKEVCGPDFTAVLIPAKRKLECAVNTGPKSGVGTDVTGVLSHLFHMRNKPEKDPQHEAFNKISKAFSQITGGLVFNVYSTDVGDRLELKIDLPKRGWVPADGRGIRVCDEWNVDFERFRKYVEENLGQRPIGYTLDRINNDGNYQPGNIRWASRSQQAANQRRGPRGRYAPRRSGVSRS
jgi:hypothetical protein